MKLAVILIVLNLMFIVKFAGDSEPVSVDTPQTAKIFIQNQK